VFFVNKIEEQSYKRRSNITQVVINIFLINNTIAIALFDNVDLAIASAIDSKTREILKRL